MACAQVKLSRATGKLVQKIIKTNQVTNNDKLDTRAGKRDILSVLSGEATPLELMNLTDYPNGVVRCYAFWALARQPAIDLLPIVIAHLNDTEKVNVMFGDVGEREKVGDFMIEVVTPKNIDVISSKLDSSKLALLDSILIYTPNKLSAKRRAIEMARPTDKLYPRIRELVVNESNQSALVTLAKYRKQQDVPIILRNREYNSKGNEGYFYTYRAIAEYPDSQFMPLLRANLMQTFSNSHYDGEWGALYRAIAAYKSPEALELLRIPFTKVKYPDIRVYHMQFVFAAVETIDEPIYDELNWDLWTEGIISFPVFSYLNNKNPERTLAATEQYLLNSDELYKHDYDNEFDYDGNSEYPLTRKPLTEIMLDLVLQKDRSFGIKIIQNRIATADVHTFPIIARAAIKIKDQSFIGPFLKRFSSDDNPYVFMAAAKGLISFNSEEINKKILLIRSKNEYLRSGWGGEELTQLLKEENIISSN